MEIKSLSVFMRQFALVVALVPLFVQPCFAQTMYERSMAQFKAKALKANAKDFTFVVLGDSRDGDPVFKKALRLARSYEPLFILHGGDYSDKGGEGETARFLQLVHENVPDMPLFVVMGNHENRGVFAKQIGPLNFTVESKRLGLTLICLDNSDNALRPEGLEYLRTGLSAAGRAVFVAMHVPPKTKRWSWHTFREGVDDLKAILEKSQVQGVFFSHMHLYDRFEFGGAPAIITGGAGGPLATFAYPGKAVYHIVVVRVKDGKASYSMVPLKK